MMIEEQPSPEQSEHPIIWDLVRKDLKTYGLVSVIPNIKKCDARGRKEYGTPLQPFNGRNQLINAYEESLDLLVYLRSAIYEFEQESHVSEALQKCLERCYHDLLYTTFNLRGCVEKVYNARNTNNA